MTKEQIKSISIIGLGLIGTSLARAWQAAFEAEGRKLFISGYDNNFANKDKKEILNYGLNRFESDFQYLCAVDLVVLAAPVQENIKTLRKIKRFLKPKTLVVDASSTKQAIMDVAKELDVRFVGMHPIAGSELRGYQNSNPDLFRGKPVAICADEKLLKQAKVKDFQALMELIGAEPFVVDAASHDKIFAKISHLPQLLSTAIVNYCAEDLDKAGTGLQDMARLSGSAWLVWQDIFATNQTEIADVLAAFSQKLQSLSNDIRAGNYEAIEQEFQSGNENYQKLQKRTQQ
ncbi:Prephenate dehydrogenase [Chloroherpeton thalassium ATCC 35110]|uniref:Prephenate dehydrogenase n=1 Tax=Chloroherpeton thalassium (strain ATCC 35110 / GB-78) TaxID=517418 RepID=B3QYG6_CHLT3|nr:prephenate dehydrogenase/arogenate dehydrogenase family protein [Chloroherpeton thalassium]ACF13594.1 Prephenate dehydrogenase [Chloroherpeton thalassium ATCC 35110]